MSVDITKNDKAKNLRPKQFKLLKGLLDGLPTDKALTNAGYSPTCRSVIGKVKAIYQEIMEAKKQELIESTISKDECIKILKEIALDKKTPRNQIASVQQLSRMLAYDAPTKIEQNAVQQVQIVFKEDKGEVKNDEQSNQSDTSAKLA